MMKQDPIDDLGRLHEKYARDPDGQSIKVHKCDGHGKVYRCPCEVSVPERSVEHSVKF